MSDQQEVHKPIHEASIACGRRCNRNTIDGVSTGGGGNGQEHLQCALLVAATVAPCIELRHRWSDAALTQAGRVEFGVTAPVAPHIAPRHSRVSAGDTS